MEDMEHRYSQHARWRSDSETGWWQGDVTHKDTDDEGRPKEEPNGRKSSLKRKGAPRPVTRQVQSSWWYLCRSSPGRPRLHRLVRDGVIPRHLSR